MYGDYYVYIGWIVTDVYLDVLEVFTGENIKEMKTEMIGMMVRHLIVTNTGKRDAIWQKDM